MNTPNDLSPIASFGDAQSQRPCAPAATVLDRISPLQNIMSMKTASGAHIVTPTSAQSEDAKGNQIQIDLPGVARNSIKLHARGNLLILEASRPAAAGMCALIYRATILPSGDASASNATASFQDGVLNISVPKGGVAASGGEDTPIAIR